MKGLASFVMRGLSQAVMVCTVLALLSLLLPLLGIVLGVFSAASVGLVTLRNGMKSGLAVSLLATLACGLFMAVSFGNPLPALGFLLVQWMPAMLLGQLLRTSRSLDLTLQSALGFGMLVILAQHLLLENPSDFWQGQLQPMVEQLVTAGVLEPSYQQLVLAQVAGWMSGLLATGLYLQLAASLLVSRWWQALLYNPGGFKEEFYRFRLPKMFGVLGLASIIVLVLPSQTLPEIFQHTAILLSAIFFLAGLAVTHGVLGRRKVGGYWLGLVYFMLIILMPQVALLLSVIGLADIWMNFRSRFERSGSTG